MCYSVTVILSKLHQHAIKHQRIGVVQSIWPLPIAMAMVSVARVWEKEPVRRSMSLQEIARPDAPFLEWVEVC